MWERTRALNPAICAECREDVWPGDEILFVREEIAGWTWMGVKRWNREIYCKECSELYIDSQEMGQDDQPAS